MKIKLIDALMEHHPLDENEAVAVRETLRFLNDNPENAFDRNNFEGHLTGSALVIDNRGRVLLNHHKKANIWIQFGGHCDGDSNIERVALRETMEESGIDVCDLEILPKPYMTCAVYEIPANRTEGEPAHKHYDIAFLVIAKNTNFKVSSESTELKWCTLDEAKKLVNGDVACTHMIKRAEMYFSGLANHKAIALKNFSNA